MNDAMVRALDPQLARIALKKITDHKPRALERPLPFAYLVEKLHHEDITRTLTDSHKLKANSIFSPSKNNISTELDKTKFNQLKADDSQKFEVPQAVNFADLARQAQLVAQYSQMQSQYTHYFN